MYHFRFFIYYSLSQGIFIHEQSWTVSIGSNLVGDVWKAADSIDGYVPITIVGFSTNSPHVIPYKALFRNGMVDCQLRSFDTSVKSVSFSARILYIKPSLLKR